MDRLPHDVFTYTTEYLTLEDVQALVGTCTRWRRWLATHRVWSWLLAQPPGLVPDDALHIGLCGLQLDVFPPLPVLRTLAPTLRTCILQDFGVEDVPALSRCTALRSLTLDCPVRDIWCLATCTALTTLDLVGTRVADLSPLTFCTGLTSLDLSDTWVRDVSPLAYCTRLTDLDISSTRVVDVSPLAVCTALGYLDLRSTHVADVSPLACCPALTVLCLAYSQVTDLRPLRRCTQLKFVGITGHRMKGADILRAVCPDVVLQPY